MSGITSFYRPVLVGVAVFDENKVVRYHKYRMEPDEDGKIVNKYSEQELQAWAQEQMQKAARDVGEEITKTWTYKLLYTH